MARDDDDGFDPALAALADYVADLSYEDIPADVVEREKRHVLDTLGCMLYGTTTPWVQKVHRAVDALGSAGPASVVGSGRTTEPGRAVLVNGTAAHSMDFDDHCQEAGVHAGSATVPAALAFAETSPDPVDGETFLAAVAAGVEVGIRSGFGVGYGSVGRGWHIAGWTGAFAAAATTGFLSDLDRSALGHALAVGGTQGCGLLGAQYGAEVKRFHMGKAAEAGYLAAALAAEGFTGDTGIFADRYGAVGPTMSDDYDADAVRRDLGTRYRLLDKLTFKPFPSVGQVHAPVEAVETVLRERDLDPTDVTEVVVRTTETVKSHVGWPYEPRDVMSAQANIQYAVATLLVDGDVTIDAYTPAAIRRPAVLDRIDDVRVVVDDDLDHETFGAIVEVGTAADRFEGRVETPRGYPSNPMTDAQHVEKFRTQASHVLPTERIEAAVEFVMHLERQDDVTDLVRLLTPDESA